MENCPIELDQLYSLSDKSVKFLHDEYDAKKLIELSARQCERFPLEVVTILRKTILSAKNDWLLQADENEERILKTAMRGEEEARRIAIDVINYRGEQGEFRWKDLLGNV